MGKQETPFEKQFTANSPLIKEMRKPPLKFIKYQKYGVKKLKRK